jgi:hypothetical protein
MNILMFLTQWKTGAPKMYMTIPPLLRLQRPINNRTNKIVVFNIGLEPLTIVILY